MQHLRARRRSPLTSALVVGCLAVGTAACGSAASGVAVGRSDEGTTAAGSEDPNPTGATPDGAGGTGTGASGGTGVPLDPSGFGADLPALLDRLGFPAGFPVPEIASPADVVGVRVDQSVVFGESEVEYEVAVTQPAPEDEDAFFEEWLGRFDDEFGTGGEFGRGSSNSDVMETVFRSAGFPDSDSGSWDVWITRPVGTTSSTVTVGVTASFNGASFVPLAVPGDAPELPDLSTCTNVSGDVEFRAYDDVTNGPDDHGYRLTFDLRCPGTTVLDATTTWVTGLEAGGQGEVHVGDGYANVANLIGGDGLTYGVDALLADDDSGDTLVHVRIERPV